MLGTVYKIESPASARVYVGSTTLPLHMRMSLHRSAASRYARGQQARYYTAYDILALPGAAIVALETVMCESRHELTEREQAWIERLDCVNQNRALTPPHMIKKRMLERYHEEVAVPCMICRRYYKAANRWNHMNTARHQREAGELAMRDLLVALPAPDSSPD